MRRFSPYVVSSDTKCISASCKDHKRVHWRRSKAGRDNNYDNKIKIVRAADY